MYYIKNGMLHKNHEPLSDHSNLVQFSNRNDITYVVSSEGYLRVFRESKMSGIIFENVKNVHIEILSNSWDSVNVVTLDGKSKKITIDHDNKIIEEINDNCPDHVIRREDDCLLCSDNKLYKFRPGGCTEENTGFSISGMISGLFPMLVSDTGKVYSTGIYCELFSVEPVLRTGTNTIMTESGRVYWNHYYEGFIKRVLVKNPGEVMQLCADCEFCSVLYYDGTLIKYELQYKFGWIITETTYDVDCINGYYTRKPRPKSARASLT